MPNEGEPGELAHARLEFPVPSTARTRRNRAGAVAAIDATILRDDDGAMTVAVRTLPAAAASSLPLLACLQFIARFEDVVAEALTNAAKGKP
jgi:hypothetical protein